MATGGHIPVTSDQSAAKAREAEADGHLEKAAALYEQAIKANTRDEFSFDRLMIVYRKLKQFKKELQTINKAIRQFEGHAKRPAGRNSAKQQKLTTLSDAFMKNTGLKDKKGKLQYLPEPISRWTKRKSVVENKLK